MVAIVGAGEVGATTAHALASFESVEAVRLIDAVGTIAAGKALDIRQAGPVERSDTRVTGSTDLGAAHGATVIVVADQASGGGDWTGDAGLELVRRLHAAAPKAPIVFAGASHRDLMLAALRELVLPPSLLVGTAPEALVSAARALAAVSADCSAADVSLVVVGRPGGWIPAWNEATLGGSPLVPALSAGALAQLERRVKASWPPGPFALGSAAACAVTALVRSSRRRVTVFAAVDSGGRPASGIAALPATLGPAGVRALHAPVLSARERVDFETALLSR